MQSTRRRAACQTCHARKVACDISAKGPPCSNCTKVNRHDCHVHQKRRRGTARSNVVHNIAPALNDSATLHQGNCPSTENNHSTLQEPTRHVSSLQHHITGLINSDSHHRHLVEFVEQPTIHQRPIDRNARVTYVGSDVSNLNFLVRQKVGERLGPVWHHPTNRIARQLTAYEPDRLPAEALQLPDKAAVDALLAAYFQHVNPGFPVIDEISFMAKYDAQDPSDPPSLLLLQSMLVAGAHVMYDDHAEREACKATFFRRAKILVDARFERNRDVVVQAALLLTWHSDGAEDVAANAWLWARYAATIALGLGMHRDAEPSTLILGTKRMWRRVFWLLFVCDLFTALQFGRPQAIRLDECDVQDPMKSDFDACGKHTRVRYVMQLVKLSTIISEATKARSAPRLQPGQRQTALAEADARLAQWTLELPDEIRLKPTLTLGVHATVLQLLYNNALILLHRPKPQLKQSEGGTKPEDADICSAAAAHVQPMMEGIRERGLLKYLPSSMVDVCFTALIQLNVEVSLANPVLAIAARRRYDSLLLSLQTLSDTWPRARPIVFFFEHIESRRRATQQDTDRSASAGEFSQPAPSLDRMDPTLQKDGNIIEDPQELHDWQQLFDGGIFGTENLYAGNNDWDEWQALYWQDMNEGSLPSDFGVDT